RRRPSHPAVPARADSRKLSIIRKGWEASRRQNMDDVLASILAVAMLFCCILLPQFIFKPRIPKID
ncbi:unnamed protein product, partial [Phaeothamnion confervicola]